MSVARALLIALVSCSSPAESDSRLAFEYTGPFTADGEVEAAAAVVSTGTVVAVSGVFTSPTPCYELAGSLHAAGDEILLLVRALGTGGDCPASPAVFEYEATIVELDPGSYTFAVHHRTASQDTRTILEQPLSIQ